MNTYIIDAIRTPIGNFGGMLKGVRTDDLGAIPIRELVKRTGIDTKKIDDIILGCANPVSYTHLTLPTILLV